MKICRCKDCKKAARGGKVLGDRMMGFWMPSWLVIGEYEYYYGKVSCYVNHPKFMKGRIRKERRIEVEYDY